MSVPGCSEWLLDRVVRLWWVLADTRYTSHDGHMYEQ
jgi:hypothetical protein